MGGEKDFVHVHQRCHFVKIAVFWNFLRQLVNCSRIHGLLWLFLLSFSETLLPFSLLVIQNQRPSFVDVLYFSVAFGRQESKLRTLSIFDRQLSLGHKENQTSFGNGYFSFLFFPPKQLVLRTMTNLHNIQSRKKITKKTLEDILTQPVIRKNLN